MRLIDTDETVAQRVSDIRGRRVLDKDGQALGKSDALLLDEEDQKIRFIEVASGGFLGLGQAKSIFPVDAITEITDQDVHINQTAGHVGGAPAYDPALVDQLPFWEDTYGYYGILPYWSPAYAYPIKLGSGQLDRS